VYGRQGRFPAERIMLTFVETTMLGLVAWLLWRRGLTTSDGKKDLKPARVDWLADALLTLAERRPLEGNWYDTGSRLRVWMPPVRLERLVKLAFDQIRQASATTPAVLIRQLDAIRRLAPRLPDACRQVLSEQADAIREFATALVALDRRDLDAAWCRARTALDALPSPSSAGRTPA